MGVEAEFVGEEHQPLVLYQPIQGSTIIIVIIVFFFDSFFFC
jgi:hypothetical protein